ncbi:adenosylcobinamide-phosphate synthase CbiB [Beijerinckia sp. L45]|uniref:adenosylcobinamide-phosphate synthase CbiB n=1 Tax=Beijerinckia sp. L45 TaxID=1641855 RepID=UPI00131A6F82|nr:adenosylcobinamide-phosphate synthase CbiB [Beijerinckia sp. L45]
MNPAIAFVSLVLEAVVGYPPALFRGIGHPVTWLGALLHGLDRRLNRDAESFAQRRRAGFLALVILLLVAGAGAVGLAAAASLLPRFAAILLLGLLASPCMAQRSLDNHVRAVGDALRDAGLPAGRAAVAMIVGRDTQTLDEAGVARAAIESLAENFSDGIVAPALYLAIGGLPGGVLYKAVNTADSMIGHRTSRFEAFGFAAAKLDDVVNWPAARLAGLWIVFAAALTPDASGLDAWRIMRRDARGHPSPNAGWPEAAMAGALGIRLGGPRAYGGLIIEDAAMGDGISADLSAISRALSLYRLACGLNALAILVLATALWR